MTRRKSRRKRRKRRRTRRYNKRRRRRTRRRRRRSHRRGGLSMGMNTVNLQIKAKHAYATAEAVRQKDKESILWRKGDGKCYICGNKFGKFFGREHHCRSCGEVVCDKHSKNQQKIYRWALYKTQGRKNRFRECDNCFKKENEAIKKVSGKNENLAIAALRRAMFENCKINSNNRKELIENCRNRPSPEWGLARLPSPKEIIKASKIKEQDNSEYEGSNWTVRKQIDKIYPARKKEKEQETDMVGAMAVARRLGLDSESRLHSRKQGRAELMARAKGSSIVAGATANAAAAARRHVENDELPVAKPVPVIDAVQVPSGQIINVDTRKIPIAPRQGGRKTRRRRRRA